MRVTNEILGVRGLNGYGVKAHTYQSIWYKQTMNEEFQCKS